ncbi:MAG: PQQ-dependent sugar dehydrogenase [Solirubrobacterales bacterium]
MTAPLRRCRRRLILAASLAAGLLWLVPGSAGAAKLSQIGSFDQPVHIENAPGKKNRKLLFVVEKPGRVIVLRGGVPRPSPFLDLTDLVLGPEGTEQGLLSIAFHPRYERNRAFYVYFTDRSGDNAVYEFRRSKKSRLRAVRGSGRLVLHFPHPDDATNHNGGQIQFGPDRLLYVAPGDGASTPLAAQDPNSLLGKVLRIDPLKQTPRKRGKGKRKKGGKRAAKRAAAPYGIPRGNPFVGGGGRPEVYSLGLRNPFRFSFDRATGAIAIGDVGASTREEINYRGRGGAAGVNFGWPRFEGTLLENPSVSAPGAVPPILDYPTRVNGTCAVTGGYVVRDRRLASLLGRYLYADFCAGEIRSLIPSVGGAAGDAPLGLPAVPLLTSFGEGRNGVIFVTSLSGAVYRLDP